MFRDFYLLTKVQLTGTIVWYQKKDEKHIFGCKCANQLFCVFVVDDGTGVVTCILWMNQYNNRGGSGGQSQLRVWLNKHNVGLGDTVSVLAAIEYFKGAKQLTVHKLRLIRDVGEEMLQ